MRRMLYTCLIAAVALMIALTVFAFHYFEKEKHQGFLYTVEIRGEKVGLINVDRYKTEDKIIYRSVRLRPKEIKCRKISEKITSHKNDLTLEKFTKESHNFGTITSAVYIKNKGKTFDFLALDQSRFSAVSDIAHFKNISVFDPESIVTHMPIVDKYDFLLGGAQTFNIAYHTMGLLPPARDRIVFKSTRDDYLRIGKKKIKTECIIIKSQIFPESSIWVSKSDRSIVQLEIKGKGLLIKRVLSAPKITVKDYTIESQNYISQDILFPSDDIALAGTLAIPTKEGKLGGVILVTGEGPYDRENAGLYTAISHKLARAGYVVLRYDKRGIGGSQGDALLASIEKETKDIANAFGFLSNHERVDKNKIFIIAHSETCSVLPRLDFSKAPARGLIMLGMTEPTPLLDFKCEAIETEVKMLTKIDDAYPDILRSLKKETLTIAQKTRNDYIVVQGRHVFTQRMREFIQLAPLDDFKKLDRPLAIMHGKKDTLSTPSYLENVETYLGEGGFQEQRVMNFLGLGHFFGEIIDEPGRLKHYDVNEEVLEAIQSWISLRCADKAPGPDTMPLDLNSVEGLTNL